ncbi:MAG: sugar phosphate nucleotidyltransferase, partial [Thermodesulfobacteriota bacterium]
MKPQTLAMILAGGRVDELNVLTAYRPKSAVPFGGFARVIDFPLSNLMHSGLERVAILSQYRCYSLINHLGTGSAWDMTGRHRGISILPPFQGSAGSSWYRGSADAVYQNLDFVRFHDPEEILILSGDHIYKMDYRQVIDYHRRKNADLTIACVRVPRERAHRFGVADIDDEDGDSGGRILRYAEKPASPEFDWASLTVYCFRPRVLVEALEYNAAHGDSFEFGRDIIPQLLREQRRVYGYRFKGYWGYTRTIEEYWQTSMDLLGPEPAIP